MSVYAVGDVQGCYDALRRLLDELQFDENKDTLWLTGDLVNRGCQSLAVLRFVKQLGPSAVVVLGNHDLHLLALQYFPQFKSPKDTLCEVLSAPDAGEILDWLRVQPLMHFDEELNAVLVHAGIVDGWTVEQALARAAEVEAMIRGDQAKGFFKVMYGDQPNRWSEKLTGWSRLRFITNAFTRLRFYDGQGQMVLKQKGAPADHPRLTPWFKILNPDINQKIVFGHWSALGFYDRDEVLCLDTGCVWGGQLTAVCLNDEGSLEGQYKQYTVANR